MNYAEDLPKKIAVLEKWESKSNGRCIRASIGCDCHDPSHTAMFDIEYDQQFKDITLTFFVNTEWWPKYNGPNDKWYEKIQESYKNYKQRIKAAFRLLFTGYIETSSTLILSSSSIENVIKLLQDCKNFVENDRKQTKL